MPARAPIERGPRSCAHRAFSPSLPPPNVHPASNSDENQNQVNVLRERITQLIPLTSQRRRYDHCVSTASLILGLCAGPPAFFTSTGNSSCCLPRRPLRLPLRSCGLNTPKADPSSCNGSRCPRPTYRPVREPKRMLSSYAGKGKEHRHRRLHSRCTASAVKHLALLSDGGRPSCVSA